jgi:hypothetical protein
VLVVFAELEGQVDQLKSSEMSMKNLFYREQEARQVIELDYKELAFESEKHMDFGLYLTAISSTSTNHCRS